MTGYSVKIARASEELSAKRKLMLQDTSDATKLDEAIQDCGLIIKPAMWAVLEVHNEKSENKDYEVYIIVDSDGTKYTTGSAAFWSSFTTIWDVMSADNEDEDWSIKVYHKESKNYSGKSFITCSVI